MSLLQTLSLSLNTPPESSSDPAFSALNVASDTTAFETTWQASLQVPRRAGGNSLPQHGKSLPLEVLDSTEFSPASTASAFAAEDSADEVTLVLSPIAERINLDTNAPVLATSARISEPLPPATILETTQQTASSRTIDISTALPVDSLATSSVESLAPDALLRPLPDAPPALPKTSGAGTETVSFVTRLITGSPASVTVGRSSPSLPWVGSSALSQIADSSSAAPLVSGQNIASSGPSNNAVGEADGKSSGTADNTIDTPHNTNQKALLRNSLDAKASVALQDAPLLGTGNGRQTESRANPASAAIASDASITGSRPTESVVPSASRPPADRPVAADRLQASVETGGDLRRASVSAIPPGGIVTVSAREGLGSPTPVLAPGSAHHLPAAPNKMRQATTKGPNLPAAPLPVAPATPAEDTGGLVRIVRDAGLAAPQGVVLPAGVSATPGIESGMQTADSAIQNTITNVADRLFRASRLDAAPAATHTLTDQSTEGLSMAGAERKPSPVTLTPAPSVTNRALSAFSLGSVPPTPASPAESLPAAPIDTPDDQRIDLSNDQRIAHERPENSTLGVAKNRAEGLDLGPVRTDGQEQNSAIGERRSASTTALNQDASLAVRELPGPKAPSPDLAGRIPTATAMPSSTLSAAAQEFPEQIGERVVIAAAGQLGKAEIRLTPQGLGSIQIDIQYTDDGASVQLQAVNPQARELLEAGLPRLREMLDNAGIRLNDAAVSQGGSEPRGGEGGKSEQSERASTRRPHRSAAEGSILESQPDDKPKGRQNSVIDTYV